MKNKLILVLVVLMVAVSVLAVSAQDATTVDDVVSESVSDDALSIDNRDDAVYRDGENSGNTKDVWIDQTKDVSMIYINGEMRVYDRLNSRSLVLNLSNSSSANFSTVDSTARSVEIQTVYNALDYAKDLLNANNIKWTSWASQNTTKVVDNRKYETFEEGDAQIVGDVYYLDGAYGLTSTVMHIASGSYAKIMNLTVFVFAEADFNQTQDDPVDNTTNNTGDNATNTTSSTVDNVTNNTQNIPAVDNATNTTNNTVHTDSIPKKLEKTGIPFAILIVAIFGLVFIRRRR